MNDKLTTGTTTLGLICKDCIILAADRRMTAGSLISGKNMTKINKIADNVAVTIAGTVSDIMLLIKLIRAELKLREVRMSRKSSVKEAANLLSSYVYSNIRNFSVIPGITHFLLAGSDGPKLRLYDIFADGSAIEMDNYVSSGSGSIFVYGVLEANYKPNMSEKEGIELASQAVNAALQRDTGSGNGLDVWVIDKNGIRVALEKEVTQKVI